MYYVCFKQRFRETKTKKVILSKVRKQQELTHRILHLKVKGIRFNTVDHRKVFI